MKMGKDVSVKTEVEKAEGSNLVSKYAPSKLNKSVQELIQFINDKALMEKSMVQVGYDVKKLPLGHLSDATVLAGYKVLQEIDLVLSASKKPKTAGLCTNPQLKQLSNQFYSTIPHNFGFANMANFVIDSPEKLK